MRPAPRSVAQIENSSSSYLYEYEPSTDIYVEIKDDDNDILNYIWTLSKIDGYGQGKLVRK